MFTPITNNYLYIINKLESNELKKKLHSKKKGDDYQEAITMLPTIFPHQTNRGYDNWASVLKSVNGTKIKSFKHLVKVLDSIDEPYTKFEFEEQSTIILDTKKAKDSFKDIQYIYRLSSDRGVE